MTNSKRRSLMKQFWRAYHQGNIDDVRAIYNRIYGIFMRAVNLESGFKTMNRWAKYANIADYYTKALSNMPIVKPSFVKKIKSRIFKARLKRKTCRAYCARTIS